MDSIASPNRISPPGNSPAPLPFPAGLRVLVVDDDRTCLRIVEQMLQSCLYNVTTCSSAKVALSILRGKKQGFDLVLSDVHMPDMDGFKLLEHIGLEMDLPVIMMSEDGGKEVVMKGVTHGACDYLIKPVRIEAVRTLWQHVVRKKRNELKDAENSGSLEESDKQKRGLDDSDNASSVNEGNWKNGKRRKEGKEEEDDEAEEREDSSNLKKQRVVWSAELHQQFVNAVSQLGVEKAVPKKILELMNVPGITRENVASHLQKYRLYLRRLSVPNHQGRFDTQLAYGSCNPLDGYDLQALQVSGQLPPQSLVAMHPGARRISNSASCISSVDSVSFFNPDEQTASSKLRSAQLTQSQQAIQSYGNMGLLVKEEAPGFLNLSPTSIRMNSSLSGVAANGHPNNPFVMQMTQRGQSFSHSQPQARGQNNTLTSTMGQQIPTGRGGSTINGNTGLIGTYANSASYSPVTQAQYGQFQNSGIAEPNGNFYPVVSNIGATGMFQEIVPAAGIVQAMNNSTGLKGAKEFIPSYSLFSDLHQSKSQDWKLQSNIDFCSSNSAHQDLNAAALSGGGTGRNTCTVRKEIISVRAEIEQKFLVDNSRRVRAEGMPNSNAQDLLFSDNIIPNELMSVISRQPQEGIGQDDEFNFDGFPLDNISV